LAWAAVEPGVAEVGRVGEVEARDLAVRVAVEPVWAARACGNPAACLVAGVRVQAERAVAARVAAQAGERELALAQAPGAEEVQVMPEERVEGAV